MLHINIDPAENKSDFMFSKDFEQRLYTVTKVDPETQMRKGQPN